MKKYILLLLALVLTMSLCACGEPQPADDDTTAKAADNTTAEKETQAPGNDLTAEEKMELARTCIDKSVTELYALIGEPDSSDYAPSCLTEGGEDGNLYYDGFIVFTLKTGDTEIVQDVDVE